MVRGCSVLLLLLAGALEIGAATVILDKTQHLGTSGEPEWSIFEGKTPDGTNFTATFDAPVSAGEQTLFIRQDDVKQDWNVTLNGTRLGKLFLMEAPLVHTLAVPAGLLKPQGNKLEISGRATDDILLHEIRLEPGHKAEIFKHELRVTVRERGRSVPLPCRITILDDRGHLAAFYDFGGTNIASRPGVIYTGNGQARLALAPGNYTFIASHGPEFGINEKSVRIPETDEVNLSIAREVETTGAIAMDTHIHTLSLSKHGDATLPERAITLAAEGVELAIVTEHNQHADYSKAARELGLDKYFTSVPGNEVTTRKGHFNIFPVSLAAPPPDYSIEDWPKLFEQIRAVPNVRVAIINHPTDVHSGFVPFAATNLNLATGRNLRGEFDFPFDAMEVINSGAMNSDWMAPFRAWFALLNRGYKITAIAASDSHDVSRFIVGQGRTYLPGNDSAPGEIDVAEACENVKRGRAVVSLGLFAQLSVTDPDKENGAFPGDLFSARGKELLLTAMVEAPAWSRANQAVVYANGRALRKFGFSGTEGVAQKVSFEVRLPVPKQDTYYVLIAEGPGVTNQFWAFARPYQPSSKVWNPTVIAATNPVWVDADGDGKFSSPREYAKRLAALPIDEVFQRLGEFHWAVATQTAELLEAKGVDLRAQIERANLSPPVRAAFLDYLAAKP